MTSSPAVELSTSADRDVVVDLTSSSSSAKGVVDISVQYRDAWAIVMVGGDLDLLTAPDLLDLLRGVIGRGHRNVLLDLEHVSLLGAAGVGAIATAAIMARCEGGELTIQSPSPLSRRVLQACAMSELISSTPLGMRTAGPSIQHLVA